MPEDRTIHNHTCENLKSSKISSNQQPFLLVHFVPSISILNVASSEFCYLGKMAGPVGNIPEHGVWGLCGECVKNGGIRKEMKMQTVQNNIGYDN
jgi:hypothetical protein